MKMFTTKDVVVICCLVAIVVVCITGLVTYADHACPSQSIRSPGLVKVHILEILSDEQGKWYLLQAEDGQRCYTRDYRGKVDDTYYAWPEELNGYQIRPAEIQLGDK